MEELCVVAGFGVPQDVIAIFLAEEDLGTFEEILANDEELDATSSR